jgi:hypothetical protein
MNHQLQLFDLESPIPTPQLIPHPTSGIDCGCASLLTERMQSLHKDGIGASISLTCPHGKALEVWAILPRQLGKNKTIEHVSSMINEVLNPGPSAEGT